jgi:ribose transport system substrate-binding protein
MNKRVIPALLILIFTGLIVFIIKIPYLLWNESVITSHPPDLRNYGHHFAMIVHNTEESYWHQVYAGASAIARKENAAMEYYSSRFLNLKELERFLEMAVLSSVDGLLISVPDKPEFHNLINEATAKGIPVISFSGGIPGNNRLLEIGVSMYDLGYKSGEALHNVAGYKVKTAVLINTNLSVTSYNDYLKGFQAAVRDFPNLQPELVFNSKGESISAEEQTQYILKNHPEIQAIICTDPNDTLGVAKVVVDLNRVSQVTIIGSGLTKEIMNYIKLGVIRGVWANDPYELGVRGVSSLLRLKKEQVETRHVLPLFLVEAGNVGKIYYDFFDNATRGFQ